jgi:hypothetical protein
MFLNIVEVTLEVFGRTVDRLLEVSVDIIETGRGITVALSLKPTFPLGQESSGATGLAGESGGVARFKLVTERETGVTISSPKLWE